LLSSLSPQFRKNLGGFAMNVNTYKNKKYDVTDLTYMYENLTKLRKQERCIELEMAFLDGDIPSDDYKNRFYSILYPELHKDIFDNWNN
jgi:hypothetical protein